jgi:biopolymer transport protein ExbB/TolQ
MQQFFIAIILVLGLSTWYLFNQNETLTANNIKLESAVEEQKRTMEVMKEQYEKQGKSLLNMSRRNAEIEQEKAEYLSIFSRHNLDLLALKKPGMIELRMNNASEKVMEGIEDDTKELYNINSTDTND